MINNKLKISIVATIYNSEKIIPVLVERINAVFENLDFNYEIILVNDNSPDNFLISPCKCKGSCEGVHVQCLKMWIDSKVKKEVTGMVVSYNFTKF